MISMNLDSLKEAALWQERSIKTPKFDVASVVSKTTQTPTWLHFGAGNIFRGFVARLQQDLLNQGLVETGVIAADTFDYEIIDKIYKPYDNLTLMVDLKPSGDVGYEIIGSITEARKADPALADEMARLREIVASPSLQLISFTITEKGYALRNMSGDRLPVVEADLENGPEQAHHAMSIVCALLWERFQKGACFISISFGASVTFSSGVMMYCACSTVDTTLSPT